LTTRQGESLDFLEKVAYTYFMARPAKDPKLRMSTDLRIPVTEDQKQLIQKATADNPAGLASWAREVLLNAAQEVARDGKRRK